MAPLGSHVWQAEEEGEPVASESHSGEEGATPMEAASPSVSPTAHSPMGGQWGAQGAAGPGAVVAQSAGAFAPQLRTGEVGAAPPPYL